MSAREFESAEQRLEIALRAGAPGWLAAPEPAWADAVAAAGARILSTLRTGSARADLLSESSLIVRSGRLVAITCGRARVARAAGPLLAARGAAALGELILERAPPHLSCDWRGEFADDALEISRRLGAPAAPEPAEDGGLRCRWALAPVEPETTVAMAFTQLDPSAAGAFRAGARERFTAATLVGLPAGARFDEHLFRPSGYSLNLLSPAGYLTLHVSVQPGDARATLESNLDGNSLAPLLASLRARLGAGGERATRYVGRRVSPAAAAPGNAA